MGKVQRPAETTGPTCQHVSNNLRLFDHVFIETTQITQISNGNSGSPATVHQAITIGDNAFGHAISLPVELRDGGVLDFGREHALA